jgi:hypothetical protein
MACPARTRPYWACVITIRGSGGAWRFRQIGNGIQAGLRFVTMDFLIGVRHGPVDPRLGHINHCLALVLAVNTALGCFYQNVWEEISDRSASLHHSPVSSGYIFPLE